MDFTEFSFLRRHRLRLRTKEDFIFWGIVVAVFVISDFALRKLKPDMNKQTRKLISSSIMVAAAVISMFILP